MYDTGYAADNYPAAEARDWPVSGDTSAYDTPRAVRRYLTSDRSRTNRRDYVRTIGLNVFHLPGVMAR